MKKIFVVCSWCKKWEKEKGVFVRFVVPDAARMAVIVSDSCCPDCSAKLRVEIKRLKKSITK